MMNLHAYMTRRSMPIHTLAGCMRWGLILLSGFFFTACQQRSAEKSLEDRIRDRSFPSVFQAWNPADNLEEDPEATLARHDLVFQGADFYQLKWDHPFTGLADSFTDSSIQEGRKFRERILRLNPNMVMLLEIRYRDAAPDYLPPGHAWWMRDSLGNPVPGWREGGFIRMDLNNREFRENIANKAAAAVQSGVVDGIMLDWWNEKEYGEARLSLLKKIRELIPGDALILVNANHRQVPLSAPFVNGLFMECYTSKDEQDWEQIRSTLVWAESTLREPRINCMETWFDQSREDLHKMRATTALALTHSNGYVLFSDPNRLPVPDHLHSWYGFWDADLGFPVSSLISRSDGAFQRDFSGGTVLYNPLANRPVNITFREERLRISTGQVSSQFLLSSYDGEIFLHMENR